MMIPADKKRDDELLAVLQFDSQYEKVFTAFERIYIQKERAEILRYGNWKIPEELDEKVQNVLERIKKIKWSHFKI